MLPPLRRRRPRPVRQRRRAAAGGGHLPRRRRPPLRDGDGPWRALWPLWRRRLCAIRVAAASKSTAPEMAVRTLLACAQRAAAAEGRRAEPLLAVAVAGFYCRVVVRITDDASSPPPPIGHVVACTACGAAVAEPPGRAAPLVCAQCGGSELERGGPVWLGPTASAPFVRALVGACRRPGAALPSLATLEPLLEAAAAEAELGARAAADPAARRMPAARLPPAPSRESHRGAAPPRPSRRRRALGSVGAAGGGRRS